MKFDIPRHCYIRWQAALAVLEDLQEDKKAPFSMRSYADKETIWEKTNGCGTTACFAGYIAVAPYCRMLDYPANDDGSHAEYWLLGTTYRDERPIGLFRHLFQGSLDKSSRAKTLAFLERRIKETFKESTGKNLGAPMTFYL